MMKMIMFEDDEKLVVKNRRVYIQNSGAGTVAVSKNRTTLRWLNEGNIALRIKIGDETIYTITTVSNTKSAFFIIISKHIIEYIEEKYQLSNLIGDLIVQGNTAELVLWAGGMSNEQ